MERRKLNILIELVRLISTHTDEHSDLRSALVLVRYAARPRGLMRRLACKYNRIRHIYDTDELCLYSTADPNRPDASSSSMRKLKLARDKSVAYIRFSPIVCVAHDTNECRFALGELVRLAESAKRDRNIVMYIKYGKSATPDLRSRMLTNYTVRFSRDLNRSVEVVGTCADYTIRIRLTLENDCVCVSRASLIHNGESLFSEVLTLYVNY